MNKVEKNMARKKTDYQAYYANKLDFEILQAVDEIHLFERDAQIAIHGEVMKRDFDEDIKKKMAEAVQVLAPDKAQQIIEQWQGATCPCCGQRIAPLNMIDFNTTTGYLIGSRLTAYKVVACEICLRLMVLKAQKHCLLFGLWSIWGIFLTPWYLLTNYLTLSSIAKTSDSFKDLAMENWDRDPEDGFNLQDCNKSIFQKVKELLAQKKPRLPVADDKKQ